MPQKLSILAPIVALLALRAGAARAEPRSLTLDEAVGTALAHAPALRVAAAEADAAAGRAAEAETRLLPDVGVSLEIARSSSNTVPGTFLPVQGFAPTAGPTRGRALDGGAFQTGASLWSSWDALAFTRQAAAIDVALAARHEASAASAAQRLDVAYRAADAFLVLLEADAAVRAARANVERGRVLAEITRTLVANTLRPGADASRADAELAAARIAVTRAEQAREVRRIALGEALGDPTAPVVAVPERLLDAPRPTPPPTPTAALHPDVLRADAALARSTSARRAVRAEFLPRLDLVAALWARGSGVFASPADGLVPDVANWMAGASLTWSILDIPTLRARARSAAAAQDAAAARRDRVALAIAAELQTARAALTGADAIATQTPAALDAARSAEQQARARLASGLGSTIEVAEAQRLLAQAELDDAVARLEVRRALLSLARATGDLEPFLAQARQGAP